MTYIYVGAGCFIHGIPACDLDADTLTDEQRALVEASGLYVREDDSEVSDGN